MKDLEIYQKTVDINLAELFISFILKHDLIIY